MHPPFIRIAAPACIALPQPSRFAEPSRFPHVHPASCTCIPLSARASRFPHVHPAFRTCIPLSARASRFLHVHPRMCVALPPSASRTQHPCRHPRHAWPRSASPNANHRANAVFESHSRAHEPSIHPIHSMLTRSRTTVRSGLNILHKHHPHLLSRFVPANHHPHLLITVRSRMNATARMNAGAAERADTDSSA